ncbi:transmembrane protein 248-like [Limulus polyphemus]|uniref:Transmembrane protein 248-like n=1 Tax=Limulus polyphemus TaxID=6850 RepID=A0ABM1TI29_LIMPO|nr:transmembrane protein 248-like [Limulus polyphemus]
MLISFARKTMASHPFQSLRGFAATQPPLFVFTICLMAFGITMVVLAYIVGENEMANPDVTMDWNIFLQRVTELEICVEKEPMINSSRIHSRKKPNPPTSTTTEVSVISNLTNSGNSSVSLLSRLTAKRPVVDQSKSMSALLPDITSYGEESQSSSHVSLSVAVTFKLSKKLWKMMTSTGSFSGVVTGRLLGLPGKAADQELNVTISLPTHAKHKCRKQECKISICLTFHGSSLLIPQTRHPPSCRPTPFAVSIPLLLLRSEDMELRLDSCSDCVMKYPVAQENLVRTY